MLMFLQEQRECKGYTMYYCSALFTSRNCLLSVDQLKCLHCDTFKEDLLR